MKNKIKQFAIGNFQLSKPEIVFPETHIMITVGEGEMYQGCFYIENRKDGSIRGLVYPSSFRVRCLEQGFEGNPVKVNFTYDSTGLEPGHIENGKFTVVCNGGEYDLNFTAMIEKPFVMTEYGKIQSLADFRRFAIKDFTGAHRLFRARQFYDVLKYEDVRIKNLYDNVRKWSLDEQAMEEFLVGTKQKEKLFLTLSEEESVLQNVIEDKKDSIELTKNTWGFLIVKITTDCDFIELGAQEITTEEFVGNTYRLDYVIKKDKLHAGNNYARIMVKTPYETLCVQLVVRQYSSKDENHGLLGMIAGQGLKEYLACISGKLDLNTWVENALKCVKQLRELEPENEYYMLLQAHIYLRGRREEEARWVLENGNFKKFVIGRKPEISAYYLFLTALLQKDMPTVTRALEELNRLYIKHPYSWQLLCMIINLDPKYRDYSNRLRVLERQYFNGSNQVLLYAEAYTCLQEKVVLLRKLDSFEVQILDFATKYKIITKELAMYAADLIAQQKRYNAKLVRILERAYEMYPDPRILTALCMQLIKGEKFGISYFKWYEKAVNQELKIAQLYEYYMMSVDERRVKTAFPKIVYLYFMHGINLDYKRTALLYANILTYEDEYGEIYSYYKNQMKEFAKEELLKRHINDSLRILYNRFIQESDVTLEELDALYEISHMYHVTTSMPDIKYVLVIEKNGTIGQRVAYGTHGANVLLFDKESRLVFESKEGLHYTDSISYDTVRLFYEMRYMELYETRIQERKATELAAKKVPLSIENLKKYGMGAFDDEEIFRMCSKQIREQEQMEDDFMLFICFELLKKGYYDQALLQYLSHTFCGATKDMKFLWNKSREYGVQTKDLSERIITQMLFSEVIFQEEEIFEDYYTGKPYFRLKQAYLSYVSFLYVLKNRQLPRNVLAIIMKELRDQEILADVCKVAILKYFAGQDVDPDTELILRGYLREMCEKRMIFAFYQKYPNQWLEEVQLHDKVIVEYHASSRGRVRIIYQIKGQKEQQEVLLPTYETIYRKEFVLFTGESVSYRFVEETKNKVLTGKERFVEQSKDLPDIGKFGRLNQILQLPTEKQEEAMLAFKQEEAVANQLFQSY